MILSNHFRDNFSNRKNLSVGIKLILIVAMLVKYDLQEIQNIKNLI